jgi:hypothetical protein
MNPSWLLGLQGAIACVLPFLVVRSADTAIPGVLYD